ncbi:hydroxymethylglutaryl-CoA synthase [Nocardia brasiliensis]|uniref:hydroxymethylglutaryl-CoA synthase n=1 Tax=Nocardia brasiliensis TaxID=37326 RepID=UPI0024577798|nr:hydroxymethylglutaryl-CoA synthase [Nocardia brasiliensis]
MTDLAPIGVTDIAFATTHYVLDLDELARPQHVDPGKYHIGLGQDAMSIPAADEDIVTMAAEAAAPILQQHGTDKLRTLLLATETAVDQSKAAALYLHPLLDLPSTTRIVELKQACYSGTAALQFAAGLIARDPTERVLIIATDIARYDLDSPGEPTQGAAAVAMLVTAEPAILRLDSATGIYSDDVMDFWRPNHRNTAVVDGELSIRTYLTATSRAWGDYRANGGRDIDEFRAFCYHLPFTAMASKAHKHLLDTIGAEWEPERIAAAIDDSTRYNRIIGNSYTASLYLAFISLLDHGPDLTDQAVAFLSYGSGCVCECFSGTIQPGYRQHLRTAHNKERIAARKPISYPSYRALHTDHARYPSTVTLAQDTSGPYRLTEIIDDKRTYQKI